MPEVMAEKDRAGENRWEFVLLLIAQGTLHGEYVYAEKKHTYMHTYIDT